MCTVTIVPLAEGFRLACNRDERLVRPCAFPPRVHVKAGRRCIWPIDPIGGGTWIGANDAGLAMVLLNRYLRASAPSNGAGVTRGSIVPTVLDHASMDAAMQYATSLDETLFAPFQLVIVSKAMVGVVTSDGRRITVARSCLERPLLYTSSSLGDRRVEGPRRRLFEQLVVGRRHALLRGQARFHAHQWTDSPELSVLMSRPDAATVSRTVINVTNGRVDLAYEDLDAARSIDLRIARWEFGLR